MKKTLLFLLALAFAGSVSALDNAGGITNWKAQKDSNGDVVLKVINTSPSGTPVPTPGAAVSVTPNAMASYDVLSQTATVVTLTAKSIVWLSATNGPSGVLRAQFGSSATAPVNITHTGQVGHPIAVNTASQPFGPYPAGYYLYMAGEGASITARVQFDTVP